MSKFLSILLRKLGLIKFADKLRFYLHFVKSFKLRWKFKNENPDVILPPAYFLYETFNLNYYSFYNKSVDTAKWIAELIKKYKGTEDLNILDWGCGPGRVIRHLPAFFDTSCCYFGSDYNHKYIKWCSKNLKDITLRTNQLEPPLSFDSNLFDAIYGISIFTHLSEEMHYAWFNELMRVTKPGGIIILTLHGAAFISKLSESEREAFINGNIAIKGKTKEGHRTYAAFQPESFVKKLVGENSVLEHIPGEVVNNIPQQDIWVIKKEE